MERYNNPEPYDPHAGPWPIQYSEEDKQAQREAGKELQQRFEKAIAEGQHEFHIPEGVYRIDKVFRVDGHDGLHIRASNVEIVAEGDDKPSHFDFLSCKNVELTGPLVLDGDPFGFSQGTIEEADIGEKSFLTVRLHSGYSVPETKHRFVCFHPDTGVMIPQYQILFEEVEDLGNGLIKFMVNKSNLYGPEFEAAVAVGNFICFESPDLQRGGIGLNSSTNVTFEEVDMHPFCLVWGLPTYGDLLFKRCRACRRPGTNRLMGGGFPQLQIYGGSSCWEDCEIAHNFDDLTNIGTMLCFAFKQVAPNKVYLGIKDRPAEPGMQLNFYGAYTMEKTGEATITEVARNEDVAINQAFWDALNKAHCLTWNVVPWLITLDRDIKISELEVVDTAQARPKALTFINSYIHDSLASGISLKGADRIVIENNVIQRAGYRGVGAGFDPYWWEGGIPTNVSIVGNLVIDTPYNVPDETPAINIYVDASPEELKEATGTPIFNIKIANNKIINSKTAAIGVQYANDAEVEGNILENPMAGGFQTEWGRPKNYPHASAIFLNSVRNIRVSNNKITLEHPRQVPEVISASEKTEKGKIKLENNTVTFTSGGKEPLPNGFYTKVSAGKQAEMEGAWDNHEFGGCYQDRVQETHEPGAKASYKWSGTRARVYGMLWRNKMGPVDFYVDGQFISTCDCGELPSRFAEMIGEEALKTQLLFDSGILPRGDHTISLMTKESLGEGRGIGAGIEAFDYTDAEFEGECQADPEKGNGYQQAPETCPADEGFRERIEKFAHRKHPHWWRVSGSSTA